MTDIPQKYFDAVAEELAQKSVKPGLWARAMAESGTDDARARASYIRLRVAELQEEEKRHSAPPRTKPEATAGRMPGPLKAVVGLNLVVGALSLVAGVASLSSGGRDTIVSLGSAIFSFLVVAGIFARSRFVRSLVLIFAWLGVVAYGVVAVVSLVFLGGLDAVVASVIALVPASVSALVVWGLQTASSLQYFGIGAPKVSNAVSA